MAEINFIKYHPDKELDPLFERFLLWASHILPYNKEEIIKKCEALQKIRNKFRENYTDAKNGLIDVLNKMNKALMKLLNDEQLLIIFNKQLKQLSKINKIKYEAIEDFDELYKKNHELYDTLPEHQKERFLFSNLNKEILKYFGLYKSVKEKKINNQIDDRLKELNIIKDKDLKRKKEEQEKEDKVMQEIKKAKNDVIIIGTPKEKINKFDKLRVKIQEAKDFIPKIDELVKTKDAYLTTTQKSKLETLRKTIEDADHYIINGQSNIQNLEIKDMTDIIDDLNRGKKNIVSIEISVKNKEDKKAATKKKKSSKEDDEKEKEKEAAKVEVKEEVKPTGELSKVAVAPKPEVKTEVKEEVKFIKPEEAKKAKKRGSLTPEEQTQLIEAEKLIRTNPETFKKIFYQNIGKPQEGMKKKETMKRNKTLIDTYKFSKGVIGNLYDKIYSGEINLRNPQQAAPQPVAQPDPHEKEVAEMEDRLFKIQLGDDIGFNEFKETYGQKMKEAEEEMWKQEHQDNNKEGSGLLGTIIKGIGSIFGLNSNVLSDKVIKELLQYQNQKDGNKIIDAIIIWELIHRHKNIDKSKYPEIIKDFDKQYRPKLFYIRNKFKKYDKTDKFLGGFPIGILAGLIPGALQGVSSIISAIKGNGCSSLRSKKTSNYKGGKALSLQELNNIKNSIK